MKLMTISEVAKTFNVSTRMLRYYDEIGLLPSTRKEDYAYRVYDESAVRRLQQIITLRKLRIPLKKIALIFESNEQIKIIELLQESMGELDEEISALQTIRDIFCMFITRLNFAASINVELALLSDTELISVVQMLSLSKISFKGERSMDDLNKAAETLSKLTDKDVRIIYLPPSAVASSHFYGEEGEAEGKAAEAMDNFVRASGLCNTKKDLRHYGFNNPSSTSHGYERFVTIPDDMDVPLPLTKKHFSGGLYAAHMIPMGDFFKWEWLCNWVNKSSKYEIDTSKEGCRNRCLEEHLNYVNYVNLPCVINYDSNLPEEEQYNLQLDLLVPIKEKSK